MAFSKLRDLALAHDWRLFAAGLVATFASAAWLALLDRAVTFLTSDQGQQGLGLEALAALLGAFSISAVVLLVAAAFALLVGLVANKASAGRVPLRLAASLAAGAVVVPPLAWLGKELSGGEWISAQSYAWIFHYGPAVPGAASVALLAWLALGPLAGRRRRAFPGVALFVSAALATANATLLFSIYPRLHIVAFGASALVAFVALFAAAVPVARRLPRSVLAGLTLACLLGLSIPATLFLGMRRDTRAELLDGAATATDVIKKMASLNRQKTRSAQRSLLYETLAAMDEPARAEGGDAPLPRGRIVVPPDWNVVLLIVDALRADAVPPARADGQAWATATDTPFLDRWLQKAYRFRYAYSQAACTKKSIPPLLRSLESNEDAAHTGVPLGRYVKSLGRVPIASVTSFIVEPRKQVGHTYGSVEGALDGFEDVAVYHESAMDEMVPRTLSLLDRHRNAPFFAWVHSYAMHPPGYADGHTLTSTECSLTGCYERSLRWTDRQIEALHDGMRERGLLEKTVFILGSDHGQGMGERRLTSHGSTVWESVVRVPLAIWIPGRNGRVIDDRTVGNIDIVPTIGDLLGAPQSPAQRGRSLVPLLADPGTPWLRDYFFRSRVGDIVGVVRGRQKLIHDAEADAVYRYDLDKDPGERRNLYRKGSRIDERLLRSVLVESPERFARELADKATRALLLDRLKEFASGHASDDLSFLLRLAALARGGDMQAAVVRLFDRSRSDAVKLGVAQRFFALDPRGWSRRLAKQLSRFAGKKRELDFVRGLAVNGQPSFAPGFAAARLSFWANDADARNWEPWLLAIANWAGLKATWFGPPLASMLAKASAPGARAADTGTLELVLRNVASLDGSLSPTVRADLRDSVLRLVAHPEASIRVLAVSCLRIAGSEADAPLLISKLDARNPVQERSAALRAIETIRGESSIPIVEEQGRDPLMLVDAIAVLKELGSVKGLPFLVRVEKEQESSIVRGIARNARNSIEKARKKGLMVKARLKRL
ncbi:MAG: sulfatase-like hydrolase/transferase [Deltaproteobacteria bacterium]|nr:sulfatase-like hydrolase/transferase [Deltaproteobacteria bacterium]